MLAAGYRSVPNYTSIAKDEHFKGGHPWGADLDRATKRTNRACTRGLGPSHQSKEIPVGSAYTNAVDDIHSTLEPIGTKNAVVVCSFFLLREIQASLILGRCISFDDAAQTVSITLPASKTDLVALSVTRTWEFVSLLTKRVLAHATRLRPSIFCLMNYSATET